MDKELLVDELRVEVAKPQDAGTIAKILSSGVKTKVAHGDMIWGTEPYTVEELAPRIEKGNTYIAWLGDTAVGTFLLIWDDETVWGEQPPVAAYVHQLAIREEFRSRNLGRQLLDWAGQQAAANGRELLRLDFPSENTGLRAYYEKLGFAWVGDKEVHTPEAVHMVALYERPTTA